MAAIHEYAAGVRPKLYSLTLSHPAHAARLMLEHKGLDHEVVDLLPGLHPLQLRIAGFRGATVPALNLGSRRVQGSLAISRELEQLRADPPLFPADPDRRRAVEEAERWGERELQPVFRRLFRWAASRHREVRRWMAAEVIGMPAPGVMATINAPVASAFARKSGADDERVHADLAEIPALLENVETLIADGTIGDDEPNAADFQIGTSVRVLMALEDLETIDALERDRPATALAMRVLPEYPGPIALSLPRDWVRSAAQAH